MSLNKYWKMLDPLIIYAKQINKPFCLRKHFDYLDSVQGLVIHFEVKHMNTCCDKQNILLVVSYIHSFIHSFTIIIIF